jgi:hypothetical protein
MRVRDDCLDPRETRDVSPALEQGRGHDNGLRNSLRLIAHEGWNGPEGIALLGVLAERCRRWAASIDRSCGQDFGTAEPDELLSIAWEVLRGAAVRVISAAHPWAYLWYCVRNAAAVEVAGQALCSGTVAERHMALARSLPRPVRIGEATWLLEEAMRAQGVGGVEEITASWSPALQTLLDLLVDAGAGRGFWADAIDRAIDVMAGARRSYEEYQLQRDPYLCNVLGLGRVELAALGALLVGTRRGDRARQSLLWALHRDLGICIDDVPGAARRIALLADSRPGRSPILGVA